MRSHLRRLFCLSLLTASASVGVQACKKKNEGTVAPLVPPVLEFLGASTPSGREFEPGNEIEVGCDASLTFHLGPEGDSPGTIENWSLRPPNVCGSLQQCGYISLDLFSDAGDLLASYEQAVASPYVDLSDVDLPEVAEIRATLILGNSGVAYQNDGAEVSASWQAGISSTCDSFGGAGGGPGPSTGGRPATGGMSSTGGNSATGGAGATLGGAGGLGGASMMD